jgi:YVTN family beta-propeller protein
MRTILALAALIFTAASAADPSEGLLLVVNKTGNDVSLLSLASGETVATLPTGRGPHEIAVSADGRRAVATNYGTREAPGNSLTVFDLRQRAVERTIDLGRHQRPHGIAFFPDSRRAAVTTEDSRHLLIVDVVAGRIERAIETGQDISHMVALSPDAKRAYVANIGSGSLTVIDLGAGKVLKQVATGGGAEGVAVTPGGGEIWVSNRAADTLSVVNAKSLDVVATLPSPGFPIRVVMTPDGRHALATSARSGELAIFDVKQRKEVRRLKLLEDERGLVSPMFGPGSFPVGVIVSPDGRRAFVAITGGDRIAVVDTKDWAVTGFWTAGREPDGLAITVPPRRGN